MEIQLDLEEDERKRLYLKIEELEVDYEVCLASAKLCGSFGVWRRDHRSYLDFAFANGWRERIYKDLGWRRYGPAVEFLDFPACLHEAKAFGSLSTWKLGHRKSYEQASKRGWKYPIAEQLGWKFIITRPKAQEDAAEKAERALKKLMKKKLRIKQQQQVTLRRTRALKKKCLRESLVKERRERRQARKGPQDSVKT